MSTTVQRSLLVAAVAIGVLCMVRDLWPGRRLDTGLAVEPPSVPARTPASAPAVELVSAPQARRVAVTDMSLQTPHSPALRDGAGAVTDEPPAGERRFALRLDGGPSDDPVEGGDAQLELHLVDGRTAEPAASRVHLWRIDAPGNSDWARGDQCQRVLDVNRAGATVVGLAPGRYRVLIHASGEDSAWPPEFSVSPGITSVTFSVERPIEREAWVVLYNERGTRIEFATAWDGARGFSLKPLQTPPWVSARTRLTPPPRTGYGGSGGGGSFGPTGRNARALVSGPRGFSLGSFGDDTRAASRSYDVVTSAPGLSEVTTKVRGGDLREHEYVGVMVDCDVLLREVRLPDGRSGLDLAHELSVSSVAIHRLDARTTTPWLELPITIRLRSGSESRFLPFECTFTLAEGLPPPERLTLEAKIPPGTQKPAK